MELSEKLRDNFDEMVVYKDLKKTNFFSALSLPAFMRDWLLKKFEDLQPVFCDELIKQELNETDALIPIPEEIREMCIAVEETLEDVIPYIANK